VPEASDWFKKLYSTNVEFIRGARIVDQPEAGLLLAETFDSLSELRYSKLILATGARERFLPFPGWTLPNVMGAGGLQALVKSGLPIAGKSVVISGTGPLLLAVAAYLHRHGAKISVIAEQASQSKIFKFGLSLIKQPDKLLQAIEIKKELSAIPYRTDSWIVSALGDERLERVTVKNGYRTEDIACDFLASGFHLLPNLELPILMGCEIQHAAVRVDEFQQTTMTGIYCAGESTGIGGLDLSLVEGKIAGYAATGNHEKARRLFAQRKRQQSFADLLNKTFELRDELKSLCDDSTMVCRCEDVTYDRLQKYDGWRAAKLQTRCGMGPCQGRICGGAVDFLFGWKSESIRPPVFPARLATLGAHAAGEKQR
jgi:NADPH-dependent 2,4-dienoyl-CoA reductase/sulfur reductase-like enzyme